MNLWYALSDALGGMMAWQSLATQQLPDSEGTYIASVP